MKRIIRLVYLSIIIGLILLLSHLEAWNRGYETGYNAAMSDVVLGIETPENFFIKLFDIKVSKRLEKKEEAR